MIEKIEIDGLDEVFAKLAIGNRDVLDSIKEGINKVCLQIEADAKALAPVDIGGLRESISSKVDDKSNEVVGIVTAKASYARYVEFGTGVVGEASAKQVPDGVDLKYTQHGWRYFNEKLGKWFYTKGQPAQPFLYPAYIENIDDLSAKVKEALKKRGLT